MVQPMMGMALRAALTAGWVLVLMNGGGCNRPKEVGFLCGTKLPSDPAVIRACNRPHEVCVCATNSCAVRVTPEICCSGLKYVDDPFISPEIGERSCVPAADAPTALSQGDPPMICPADDVTTSPMDARSDGVSDAAPTAQD